MDSHHLFEQICQAMADPAFYPHPVSHLERRDTHISAVFLTGRYVYKLKKPVDFGFLDFRDLEGRHRFCRQEVSLNQRLSHDVYLGVIEIRMDDEGRFFLGGGKGRVVEYGVKMKQLPDEASLEALLEDGKVSCSHMEELGRHLADFYAHSRRSQEIDHYGEREVIELNMEENFRQVEPFVGRMVSREPWEFIRQVSRAFFRDRHSFFDERVQAGRICDGHGDLRTEHIYFSDGIQIIDCIEFNERFRFGDSVVDLAFLHMDMERSGHPLLSRLALSAYVDRANDPALYSLIDFYAAYRAIVKLKVACLSSLEAQTSQQRELISKQAEDYLRHGYRYAMQFSRPTIWVCCGLPASGKSTVASRLSETQGLSLLQTDVFRNDLKKAMPSREHVVPYGQGIYRSGMRHHVYGHLLAGAQDELKSGRSVLLDGSFSQRKWREEVKQLSEDLDTNLIFVECVCDEELMRARLKLREETTGSSDARLQHLPDMRREFEPLDEVPAESTIRLDTSRPVSVTLNEALAEGYARKCAQVEKLL
jgi:hypothetical protein